MEDEKQKLWDYLLDRNICTHRQLLLVITLNGYTLETMENILFAQTGYRSLEQIKEANKE